MELIKYLFRSSRPMVLGIAAASMLSGALGAALIALINYALARSGSPAAVVMLGFAAIVLARIGTQFASQLLLVRFAQNTILTLCRRLCDKILSAPFERLEALGAPRVLATLTDDIAILSGAVQAVPVLATNLAVIGGCSIYLIWLSWEVFLVSAAMVLIGVLSYRLLVSRARATIVAVRNGRDRLFGDFRTLIEGVKELKLHRLRREDFMRKEIDDTTEFLRHHNVVATIQYMVADLSSQLLFFALIGMLLFFAPSIATLPLESLTGYLFAALYMMAPIWAVINTVPTFMRGEVSLGRIRQIGDALDAPASRAEPEEPATSPVRIEFDRVVYSYPAASEEERGFTLGPIDLALTSGELVFVTGGNGSGKSTLVKLLTGLYVPQSGCIRLNGKAIDDTDRERYRQHFTAVFADFHLFDRLYGIESDASQAQIQRYLAQLHMDRIVQVRDGRFSTTALSTGQRKRLALLTAYLEDRPVYVFDEWAADQDPAYKQIFYERLLPELKSRGKCVIVITHDDRYFHLGERVLKLEGGRLLESAGPAGYLQRDGDYAVAPQAVRTAL